MVLEEIYHIWGVFFVIIIIKTMYNYKKESTISIEESVKYQFENNVTYI